MTIAAAWQAFISSKIKQTAVFAAMPTALQIGILTICRIAFYGGAMFMYLQVLDTADDNDAAATARRFDALGDELREFIEAGTPTAGRAS
jgi:hypothetical protein